MEREGFKVSFPGKGGKDRVMLLSDRLQKLLEEYLGLYGTVGWLFEGVNGEQYSESSFQKVFQYVRPINRLDITVT